MALAEVHWQTRPGEVVAVDLREHERLPDIVTGAGFARGARGLRRLRALPDTVAPEMRVLVCGLNPSLVAADAGFGFAGATNRFWPAALEAGLVTEARNPGHALSVDGVGMTDLVKRATRGTKELRRSEYQAGAELVRRLVAWLRPGAVLFVGLEGWRAAVDRTATPGLQAAGFGGVPAYVMPSTSGLNARVRLDDLVSHLEAALRVAEGR